MLKELRVQTQAHNEMRNIDSLVQGVVSESGVQEGLCVVWVPHTTAGVTINENADPDVVRDIVYEMNKIVPAQDHYHHMEGNSDGHIKSSLFGPSQTLIVTGGRLILGTWQSVYFCEFDGPRHRRVFVKVIKDPS